MSVVVYPRLGELLRSRNLSVAELERQIEQRYGLPVDPKTLYRLAHDEPVQRADLAVAGAAAAILGVDLGDLFEVEAVPVDEGEEVDMDPAESRLLAELLDHPGRRRLSRAERRELDALVDAYHRRLHELRLRQIAELRGITVEEARREVQASLQEALAW